MNIYQLIVLVQLALLVYLAIGLIPLMIYAHFWGKEVHHSTRNRMYHIFHGNFYKVDGEYKRIPIWISWFLYPFFWVFCGILFIIFNIKGKNKSSTVKP